MFQTPALPFVPVVTGKVSDVAGVAFFGSGFLVTPGLSLVGETNCTPVTPGLSAMGGTN